MKDTKCSKRRKILMTARRICVIAAFAAAGICYVSCGEEGEAVFVREADGAMSVQEENGKEEGPGERNLSKPEQEALTSDSVKININTAGEAELTTLKGIGPAKAQKIIGFRAEHGVFKSIDELMLVPGIKEGTFSKIKDCITVG